MSKIFKVENRKKGFALVFTVMALMVALGVFYNYSMSSRAKKAYQIITRAGSELEDSVNQALSFGMYETYIMDQMIARNNESVNNSLGYFIVKDIPQNGVLQAEAEKIWEVNSTGKGNSGVWENVTKSNSNGIDPTKSKYGLKIAGAMTGQYVGGTWTFNTNSKFADEVKLSKGGYYIKSIRNLDVTGSKSKSDLTPADYFYIAGDDGKPVKTNGDDPIKAELKNYYATGHKDILPKFELVLYKNIPIKSGTKVVKDYDIYVTLYLTFPPVFEKNLDLVKLQPCDISNSYLSPTNKTCAAQGVDVLKDVTKTETTTEYAGLPPDTTTTTPLNSGVVAQSSTVENISGTIAFKNQQQRANVGDIVIYDRGQPTSKEVLGVVVPTTPSVPTGAPTVPVETNRTTSDVDGVTRTFTHVSTVVKTLYVTFITNIKQYKWSDSGIYTGKVKSVSVQGTGNGANYDYELEDLKKTITTYTQDYEKTVTKHSDKYVIDTTTTTTETDIEYVPIEGNSSITSMEIITIQ